MASHRDTLHAAVLATLMQKSENSGWSRPTSIFFCIVFKRMTELAIQNYNRIKTTFSSEAWSISIDEECFAEKKETKKQNLIFDFSCNLSGPPIAMDRSALNSDLAFPDPRSPD